MSQSNFVPLVSRASSAGLLPALALLATTFTPSALPARADETASVSELVDLIRQQQAELADQRRELEALRGEIEQLRRERADGSQPAVAVAHDRSEPNPVAASTGGEAVVQASAARVHEERDAEERERETGGRFLDRLTVSSYGVFNYYNYDWETDPSRRDAIDVERFVLGAAYEVTDTLELEAELEIEHLGTGATLELDSGEEFGEFEQEIERGGEVNLEELTLEWEPLEEIGVKVGYFPIPVGLNNFRHRPFQYFTTTRFESEVALLPDVWTEAGIELFGSLESERLGAFDYHFAIVTGLDSTGFSSANWVKGGHQTRFEHINADNFAYAGRLDYRPMNGALVGWSVYYGNSADNRPKPDLDVDAHVTIWDVHGELYRGPLEARGLYLRGHLENAAEVSLANAQLSNNLAVPRTPVAEEAYAAFVEVGVHVDWLTRYWLRGLVPFYRYDRYDTMDEVAAPVIRNPFYDRTTHTVGLNYRPLDWLVFKGEYAMRDRDIPAGDDEDTLSFGLGYDVSF